MNINGEYPGSRLKRLRVDGASSFGSNVTISGDVKVSGSIEIPYVVPDKIYTDNGTESLPAYSFIEEKSLGLARTGPGEFSVCAGGSKRLRVTSTTTEVVGPLTAGTTTFSGKATSTDSFRAPTYEFPDDDNKSYISWDPIAAEIDVKVAGTETAKIGAAQTTFFNPLQAAGVVSAGPINSGTHSVTCGSIFSKSISTGTNSVTCGTVTSGSISAGTNSITGSVITSSSYLSGAYLTLSDQIFTTFVSTAAQTINSTSFTIYSGYSTTPAISRGSAPVTYSGGTFTINRAGYYDVGFQIMWAANTTGQRSATIRINGAATCFAYDMRNAVAGGFITSNMGAVKRYFAQNDTVQVEVWQNSGGTLNIQNNGNQIIGMTFLMIC